MAALVGAPYASRFPHIATTRSAPWGERGAGALAGREGEQLQPAEQVAGEQRAEQVGRVGVEAAAGQVVEAEPELCFLDSVLDVRLRPVPGLELVRVALDVVGDEHVVVVAA